MLPPERVEEIALVGWAAVDIEDGALGLGVLE